MPWNPEFYISKYLKKEPKEKTLETEKKELEDSYKQSEYQQKLRKEMDKIRKEGTIKDWRKIIYEAEKRIAKEGK